MKNLPFLFLICLIITSCDKNEQITGELVVDKNKSRLTLVLDNDNETDYFFSYKYLSGCQIYQPEKKCYKNECLQFELLNVDGYQNKDIQIKLHNVLDKLYKINGFTGFSKSDSLMADEHKGGMNSYLAKTFFLLPKKSKVTYEYAIVNFRKECSYQIKFENINFNDSGKISSKRKLVQQEFYNNGEIQSFKPYSGNIIIDSLVVN